MIFLSWSKELSLKLAKRTASLLSDVFKTDTVYWISTEGIENGDFISSSIKEGLNKCNNAVLFLTIDNINNPWINFEAGAIAYKSNDAHIWPFAFNLDISGDFSYSPFASRQATKLNKEDVIKLLESIYKAEQNNISMSEDEVKDNILKFIDSYLKDCINIISSDTIVELNENLDDIRLNVCNSLETKCVESKIHLYEKGFETHEFYDFILNNVKKRLWVFGRKNKKLFDYSHREGLEKVFDKIKNNDFDLKVLFFNKYAEQKVVEMQQKKSHFLGALETSVNDAIDAFDENELDFNNYCKFYNVIRNEAIIVMDNFVFFSHVLYSSDGKPKHLTGSSFFALKIDNKVADYYLDIFTKTYEESSRLKELSKNEI